MSESTTPEGGIPAAGSSADGTPAASVGGEHAGRTILTGWRGSTPTVPRTPGQGGAERAMRAVGTVAPLRAVLLSRIVALPGYWLATGVGLLWGAPMSRFRVRRREGIFVCEGMPKWAYARGGTIVGAAFWTGPTPPDPVVRHEAVHKDQWKHYGLAFAALYAAAGANAKTNRFEVEAGLEDGGYVRRNPRRVPRTGG